MASTSTHQANSYFAEMILDLAQRKPGLIFTTNEPYTPGRRDIAGLSVLQVESSYTMRTV